MKYDFQIRAGTSGTVSNPAGLQFVVKDAAGVPISTTGATFIFVARADVRGEAVLRKSSADGGVIVDGATGLVTVPFTAAEARTMWGGGSGVRSLLYEVERRDPPASERTAIYGTVTVLPGVNDD